MEENNTRNYWQVTHGDSYRGKNTKLYTIWKTMRQRVLNPNNKNFNHYGGRGIKICSLWMKDYGFFKEWALTNGYKEGLTLDREDNNGNYEPLNCRWVTQYVNRHNTRKRENYGLNFHQGKYYVRIGMVKIIIMDLLLML